MEMRAQFSPKGMLAEDGSIYQEFFKPKTVRHTCKEEIVWHKIAPPSA